MSTKQLYSLFAVLVLAVCAIPQAQPYVVTVATALGGLTMLFTALAALPGKVGEFFAKVGHDVDGVRALLPKPPPDSDEPPTAGAVNTSRLLLAGAAAMLAMSLTTGCGSMRFAPPVSAGGVPGAAIEVSTPERCSQLDDRHTTYGIVAAGSGAGAGVAGLAAGLSANGRLGLGVVALAVGIVSAATAKGAQDTAATFVREGCGSMAALPKAGK
jgi:hypothetical protein